MPVPSSQNRLALPLAITLMAIFLAGAMVVWAGGLDRGRGQYDQINYHLPVIRTFVAQWPRPDLSDYQSATTPGYHLALAAVARLGLDSDLALRVVASLFTIAMLALLSAMLAARAREVGHSLPRTLAVALPVVCSMYVFTPGVWLQPDNAGWLGVLAITALAWRMLTRPPSLPLLAAASLVLLALVLIRQSHAWCAGLILAAAWLSAAPVHDLRLSCVFSNVPRRTTRTALASVAIVPAAIALLFFAKLWHGLTPPAFQSQHAGGNLATPAFALSLLAVYSAFFLPHLIATLACLWRERRIVIILAAVLGIALAIIPETTFLQEPRSSGLWNLVKILDARGIILYGRTSPLILLLAPLGAVAAAAWLSTLAPARALFALALVTGFIVAQSANANAWQRYLEPLLLMLIALAAAGLPGTTPAPRLLAPLTSRPLQLLGPVALSLVLGALTVQSLARTERFPVPTNPRAILPPASNVPTPLLSPVAP